ncbi:Biliverdin binding protein-I, partial [Operophtera brumata]
FLGQWYEVARFPTWYENYGACAYKRIQYCGRRIEIEHVFVRDGIQYVLHVNSSYTPGDEAVFAIQENNIDPVGIPLNVISTDYTNYALVYGCRNNTEIDLKYINAWVLSRKPTLAEDILLKVYSELNAVPNANVAFLETVEQREEKCRFYWTAHVQAVDTDTESGDNK